MAVLAQIALYDGSVVVSVEGDESTGAVSEILTRNMADQAYDVRIEGATTDTRRMGARDPERRRSIAAIAATRDTMRLGVTPVER